MTKLIVPVILAGGQGTRLWPMSRAARPKQFLPLTYALSLFQSALQRVSDPEIYTSAIIVTNAEYRFLVAEQAQEVGCELAGVLLEPMARNTAVAIAAAAAHAMAAFGADAVLHVLPSDHDVTIDAGYDFSVQTAAKAARAGSLVTFGIVPTSAETGYGYIKTGLSLGQDVHAVDRFVEKPSLKIAQDMVRDGGYLWNSGMFMLGAEKFLAECKAFSPDTFTAASNAVANARTDLDFVRLDADAFAGAPNISVDYAIFEKTADAVVVPVSFVWSDLGSWDAVWKMGSKDADENVTDGPVTLNNVARSLVMTDHAHVAIDGMDDITVIASEDAIYIGRLSEAQNVGAMVKTLRDNANTANLTEIHKTAYRPWGGYSSIISGERFQVKRLFVKPGKKLSLQKHHHRAEHWVVVHGTAEVTCDNNVTLLTENQSIYLPLGCTHRLANPGKILLELIEVQTGSYLGEDDIIRIEDEFGRT